MNPFQSGIKIATVAMNTTDNIASNLANIIDTIELSAAQGADVVQYPEACLPGYIPFDRADYNALDWQELGQATTAVQEAAKKHSIMVLLGTIHGSGYAKPYNSIYVIDKGGTILDRYDKRFCAGPATCDGGELLHYTPGSRRVIFTLGGISCGILICHEARYPELFRDYKRQGVQLLFHSFHAGNQSSERWSEMEKVVGQNRDFNQASTLPGIVFPATIQSMAANNFIWISCANSSTPQSCFGAFVCRPDGVMVGQTVRNGADVLFTHVNSDEEFYDSTGPWRKRSMDGVFRSGPLDSHTDL